MKEKIKLFLETKHGKISAIFILSIFMFSLGFIVKGTMSLSLPEGMLVAGTDVIYENDVTGMDSNDVQHAIDELYAEAFENILLYLTAGTGGSFENDTALTNYEGSTTFNVTPSKGHYLENLTCTGDYTLDTTSFVKGASATAKQTVTITNNGTRKSGVCTATFGTSEYNISLAGTNVTWSPTSTKVSYNSSTTATLTASTGYSITGVTCTNGYTTSRNGSTVTINNGGNVGDSTCTASVSTNSYTVTLSGSNVSWGKSSLSISYKGTASTTLTASTGYSLGTISCTNGYTTSKSGSTVTINNNGNASNSTCTVSGSKNSYTVSLSSATGGSWGSSSISVPYAGTNTVTITPSSGYQLTSISCTNSYTASYTANSASSQTVTIKNPTNTSTSTCTPTFSKRSFTVSLASATGGSWGSSSISVQYGGSNTAIITPVYPNKLISISCTNGYTATYIADSTSAQTVTINNLNNTSTSTCTPTFASAITYKTVSGANGWVGKYQCYGDNDTGTIIQCEYNDGSKVTVCDGGRYGENFNKAPTSMCTESTDDDYKLYDFCNTSLGSGYVYGGGLSSRISCD